MQDKIPLNDFSSLIFYGEAFWSTDTMGILLTAQQTQTGAFKVCCCKGALHTALIPQLECLLFEQVLENNPSLISSGVDWGQAH